MRYRYSEKHFSRFNEITAEREYLIRREVKEGVVHWLLDGKNGTRVLPLERAIALEEEYAEEFDRTPVTVEGVE